MTESEESAKPDQRSMDEILASIRRIVSDEESNTGAGGDGDRASGQVAQQRAAAPVVQVDAEAGAENSLAPQGIASELAASPTTSTSALPSGEDDVLELIDMVAPDGSVVRIDHRNQAHGTFDQTSVQYLAGAKSTGREAGQTIDPTDTAEIDLADTVGAAGPRPGASIENVTSLSTVQTETPRTEHADRTVCADSQPASSATLSREYQILEALVQRALAPLLNEWLDKNMPAIVEKITAQEIRKITDAQR